MHPRHSVIILLGITLAAYGLDATVYFSTGCGGAYTLYAVDVANGHTRGLLRTSNLGGYGVTHADLSPDGLQIAMGVKGGGSTHPSIWIANNDGTGARKIADCPYKNGWAYSSLDGLAFTDAGIYWIPCDRDTSHDAHEVYLTNPTTGATAVAYRVSGADPTSDMVALKCSNDGRRHIVWTPHDTVMNDADHATRGPLISLDAAGAVTGTRWFNRYEMAAHGYGMSPSGQYIFLVPFTSQTAAGCTWNGYHGSVVVRRWSDGAIEKCVQRTVPTYLGGSLDPTDGFNMAMCRNSEDYYAIGNAHPTYGCNGWWHIVNWRTEAVTTITPDTAVFPYSTQDIKNDSLFWCGSCLPLMTWWLGTLPSATSPVIAASPRSLTFTDAVRPVPSQTVAIDNAGAGTLGPVQATVSAGAQAWLSAAVSGSGSDQVVTVSANPGTLAAGAYQGTITLSGGNASNTVDIAVTFNVGMSVNAPSGLTVYMASDSDAACTWTDNSDNETGFQVEHALDSAGPWTLAGTVGAGVTSFTQHLAQFGIAHWYRVRAVNGVAQSGYSNAASVVAPVPRRVVIGAPAAGDTLVAGQVYTVRWTTTGGVDLVDLQYTLDDGDSWVRPIDGGITVIAGDGMYAWTVPDVTGVVTGVTLRIWPYVEGVGGATTGVSGSFTILPSTGTARTGTARALPLSTGLRTGGRFAWSGTAAFTYALAPGDRATLRIYRLDGSAVAELALPTQPGVHTVLWDGRDGQGRTVGRGCYVARMLEVR